MKIRPLRGRLAIGPALLASTMLTGLPAHAESGLETVVVTAEKKSEDLQKVPMSVQALTSEKLEDLHLTDFTDFSRYMPSVTYSVSGQGSNGGPGFNNITMRGIASDQNGNHSGPESTVGVYFDEQPITTIGGTLDIPTYDIARVEALSGPQGTLYGASSLSGTIRIITNKPDPSAFAASYDVGVNSIDHGGVGYSGHGMLNIPIADNIAIRLVAWDEQDAGYIDNKPGTRTYNLDNGTTFTINNFDIAKKDYNIANKLGGRATVQIDLDDNWTITPAVTLMNEKTNGFWGSDPSVGDLAVTHFSPEYTRDNWYQASLTIQGKISDLDLVYSGGYMNRKVRSEADYSDYTYWYDQEFGSSYATFFDGKGNAINPSQVVLGDDRFTKESHELRLSSPKEDRLRGTVGLFYERQSHFILQNYSIPGFVTSDDGSPVTGWPSTLYLADEERIDRDKAAFGEVSFDILPNLTLTGGIRVFDADNTLKGFFGFHSYEGPPHQPHCFAPTSVDNGPCTDLDAEVKSSGETHKVNLTWQVDDGKMLYATYATGFRPGGANRVAGFPGYDPDTLSNYEIGWKTTWDDNRVRFNGAFYWEDWNDIQFSFLGPNSITVVENAGGARVKGFEYDLSYLPIDGLTLSTAGAYNDARLTAPFCSNVAIVCTNKVSNAPTGTQLPITPLWKLNATARYDWMIGSNLDAHVQGSLVHQSGFYSDLRLIERAILGKNPASTTADLTAGVGWDNWEVELYAQNVTDERAQLGRFAACTPGTCGVQTYRLYAQPRTIGLTISQKFGGPDGN